MHECIWVSTTDCSQHCHRDYKSYCIALTFPQFQFSSSTLLLLLAHSEYLLVHNHSFHHFVGILGVLFFFYFYNFCSGSLTFNLHPSSASTPAFLTFHCISPYYFPNFSSAFLIASISKGFGRLLYFFFFNFSVLSEENPHSSEARKRQSSQPPKYERSAWSRSFQKTLLNSGYTLHCLSKFSNANV